MTDLGYRESLEAIRRSTLMRAALDVFPDARIIRVSTKGNNIMPEYDNRNRGSAWPVGRSFRVTMEMELEDGSTQKRYGVLVPTGADKQRSPEAPEIALYIDDVKGESASERFVLWLEKGEDRIAYASGGNSRYFCDLYKTTSDNPNAPTYNFKIKRKGRQPGGVSSVQPSEGDAL